MNAYRRAVLPVLFSFALVGCAGMRVSQPLSRSVAPAIQPVDVKVGIKQPELYAAFEPSAAGATAAVVCGSIPGLGILLAAACGGAMGAVDANVNASRAKVADELVRPLKDEIVDLKFDQLMSESLKTSLQRVPGMQLSDVAVTKTVDGKAYEESFRASKSSAVMYVNVEYRLSKDFSTLEILALGNIYPRSAPARTAAGLPAAIPADAQDALLSVNNTVYRVDLVYSAKLPTQGASPSDHVAAWKADSARLLRSSLLAGVSQVGVLLAEDLQRVPDAAGVALTKVDMGNGVQAELVSEGNGGQLLRHPNGSLHFKTTASATADAAPLKATTTGTAAGTVVR